MGEREAQVIDSSRAAWRGAGPEEVLVHRWDGDRVVFVRGTAATHWLSPSLAAVFDALSSSPHAVSGLELAGAMQLGDDDEAAALQECLDELRSLGLAWPETATAR